MYAVRKRKLNYFDVSDSTKLPVTKKQIVNDMNECLHSNLYDFEKRV